MQRHTLTFRSKKKTKRTKIFITYLVFVFFDILVYFRDQNIGFRIFEKNPQGLTSRITLYTVTVINSFANR